MNKKFKIRLRVIMVIASIVLSVFLIVVPKVNGNSKKNMEYKVVVVQEGDTLWSIVKDHCKYKDIRKTVYELKNFNNISPNIFPGQEIKIPLKLYNK